MKNTILFGGSGFFGPIILKKYPKIISIGRTKPPKELKNKHIQIKNLDNLKKLDSINFDKVIFLIGSSNHHIINKDINIGIKYNFEPLIKIMEYLKNRKIKKFICFTTILLYKNEKPGKSVSEKNKTNPYKNNYIFSKHLMEEVVNFYKKSVPSIVVRLCNIYGYSKLKRPDLVPTIMQDIFKKKKIFVWNTKPIRDFIFAEDAADAVVKLVNSNYTGLVNVGTGKSYPVETLTNIISNVSKKNISSKNKKVSGPYKFLTNINLLKKITKWKTKYTLKEGLVKTYNVMKNYY
jgi:nucleoside-diphosphate-sugar epimerase|tara:strand:+ start:2608 stop:3483 length:876 start_codon:yes stop_codon:yes gene_type:complete